MRTETWFFIILCVAGISALVGFRYAVKREERDEEARRHSTEDRDFYLKWEE